MDLPAEISNEIATIEENGGALSAERCEYLCGQLSIDIRSLMIRLLPLVEAYSKPAISSYKVGAIALCFEAGDEDKASLYFGANFEYEYE